ncbi:MAG TPA: long-chain fatty acid--CoA ligase [Candidatus Lokiarchaeia archaeon]|nr:long-chain fatty acid--CoA ligase [Candidatus Lokiarchaeia archaeon]
MGQELSLSYKEVYDLASMIAAGLASLGIEKGDRVAICSETRAEWVYTDLAIVGTGVITVTIYPSLVPAQVQYIMEDSGSRILFVDDKMNLQKALAQWEKLPELEHVVVFDKITDKDIIELGGTENKVHPLAWIIGKGKEFLVTRPDFYKERIKQVGEEDVASIIYTSGTTGVPKGVMLTHRNFCSDTVMESEIIKSVDPKFKPYEQKSLTFMPLSHSFCRTAEEFLCLNNGACLGLAGGRSPAIIETGFKVFHPTLMAGIPYVYEKIYHTIFNKIKTQYPPAMQKLFYKALEFGKKYNKAIADGKAIPLSWRIHHSIDSKLIYKRVQGELGGRLIAFVSGSARLPPEICETFWALGIRILDGYGLTESTPVTHVMRTWENSNFRPNWPPKKHIHPMAKLGSVGPAFEFPGNPYPDVEAKIAEDGEVLIRGPNVMKGYWNKPEETVDAIDQDGWLHTGDLGRIDEDGYLFITGRKKLIIKLMTGKMVAPALVEDKLVMSPLILQVLLVGQEQKYVTAFIVPNQKEVKALADEKGISYQSYQDLLQNEQILQAIKDAILEQSRDISDYETVKKFAVFGKEFNEEDGYLTPTLKIKRDRVLTDFQHVVDQLYATDKDWVIVDESLVDFHDMTIPS